MLKKCEIKIGTQGLLLLMELKFLKMMTRPQNITVACHYNFTIGRQQYVAFCGLVIIIKILILSTAGGLGCQFWFHIFFSMGFFRFLAATFFTPGVFWLGFVFTSHRMLWHWMHTILSLRRFDKYYIMYHILYSEHINSLQQQEFNRMQVQCKPS